MEGFISGRLVQGSVAEKGTRDFRTQQAIPEDKQRYFFAVAVPKANAVETVNAIIAHAYAHYTDKPHLQQAVAAVAQDMNYPAYSLKIEDGDTNPNIKGNDWAPGTYLFKFSSSYPVNAWDAQGRQIPLETIKRGFFVDVAFAVDFNKNIDHTAGVYLNPRGVRLIGYGPEITSGPTFDQMFGQRPAMLPPGASAAPVSPGPMPTATPGAAVPPTLPGASHVGMTMPPSAPGVPVGAPMTPAPAAIPTTPGIPTVSHSDPSTLTAAGIPSGVAPPYAGVLAGPPRVGG
jgi:hypothetical protein